MTVAQRLGMSPYIKPYLDLTETIVKKTVRKLGDEIIDYQNDRERIREANQKASREGAKALGINPVIGIEISMRNSLNERIIQEVKRRKLRHIDVAGITLIPRTKITAIMNRNLNEATIDLLIRILSSLGVSATIHFD